MYRSTYFPKNATAFNSFIKLPSILTKEYSCISLCHYSFFNWLSKRFSAFFISSNVFSLYNLYVKYPHLHFSWQINYRLTCVTSDLSLSLLECERKYDYIFLHKRIEKFFYWGWSFLSIKIEHISSQWVFNAWKKKMV